jgi:hypothetical protein
MLAHQTCNAVLAAPFAGLAKIQEDSRGTVMPWLAVNDARIKRRSLAFSWARSDTGGAEPRVVAAWGDAGQTTHGLHTMLVAIRLDEFVLSERVWPLPSWTSVNLLVGVEILSTNSWELQIRFPAPNPLVCEMPIESHSNLWRTLVTASLLSISTFACAVRTDQRAPVPRGAAEPDVAAVYAAVISAETQPQPGAPILVAPLTRRQRWGPYDCRPTTMTESDAWRSAIDSYIAVSRTEASIPSTLPLSRSLSKLLPTKSSRCDTQKSFRFVQMSRVGFDTTRTLAVVHRVHACSCIAGCGDGSDVFLQKQNGEWRIVQPAGVTGCGWIS